MTTVAVLADPPVPEVVLPKLADRLPPEPRVRLYRAMLTDVCTAIQRGGGDLLVNYRPTDQLSVDVDSEELLRDALADTLPEPARYEVQVGETYAGRVGNTLTHLLDAEDEPTVAVAEPTAPLLAREHIGRVAMKLRSSAVVLAPSPGGGVSVAGFSEPINFTDAYATPAIETLTARARDAGRAVDFLPLIPTVETPADLATLVSIVRARARADRNRPDRTAALIEEFGLAVDEQGQLSTDFDS
jgi:2-phospho-L-lactate guanylyltransferase (CobY/MobA/RfbA family)